MIVSMKKAFIFTPAKHAEETLRQVRELGLWHVTHLKPVEGQDVSALREEITLVNEVLGIFSETGFQEAPCVGEGREPANWKVLVKHIVDLRKRLDQLQEFSRHLKSRIAEWQPWGDFDPELISALAGKNIRVRLYKIPRGEVKSLPADSLTRIIGVSEGMACVAVVMREDRKWAYEEVSPPKMGLRRMEERLAEDERAMAVIINDLKSATCYRQAFGVLLRRLYREMEFHEALQGMGQQGEISYVAGYVPVDAQALLRERARQRKWGLLLTTPSEEEAVPTLLRNPRWARLISPVFKLLEITPGYTELDISPLFLIFFGLFFGMLIGDAGYGLVYFSLTLWAHKKMGAKVADKTPFYLFYVLSACAVGWGILTGTFFGQAWLLSRGWKPLWPQINDVNFIQSLCFLIGAVHLTIAHLWRAILQAPSVKALAEIGWGCVIWASFFLAKTLLLGDPFPAFGKPLIILGVSLVIFFINPRRNILMGCLSGLGSVALSLMNNFTDVVSYVRLFAVGLAGVAIADAFNAMAAGVGTASLGSWLAAALIAVAGHALNLILGPMSVLVHGVRLNVLEFSGHANVTWSGTVYRPLKNEG